MRQSRRSSPPESEQFDIWISYTDLMSNSFLILSLITLLLIIFTFSARQTDSLPPIIIIPDNEAFRFPVGSAKVSKPLQQYIWTSLAKTIRDNHKRYRIDTVEIIGHTDGQPNRRSSSNLDLVLEQSAAANTLGRLTPGSNADLGLMRALAIANELRKVQATNPELKNLQFYAYSAGQLYLLNGNLAPPNRNPDSSRRRIEVRFTRRRERETQVAPVN